MTGSRFALVILLGIGTVTPVALGDGDGPFGRKRMEPVRVRQLAEILRSDSDEKRRAAAIAELADADPRAQPEVIPALIAALRKDVAAVRVAAAERLGRFHIVFPQAGEALETAAESDSSQAVRDAAQQALWEYHLNGYRSARGTDRFTWQTVEPPIAKPAKPRLVTSEPLTAPVVPTAARLPVFPAAAEPLPMLGLPPGPRVDLLPGFFGPRTVLSGSLHPNLTVEPPIAKPPVQWMIPPPTVSVEPPILPLWPDPVVVEKPPPIAMDLPPIVSPP